MQVPIGLVAEMFLVRYRIEKPISCVDDKSKKMLSEVYDTDTPLEKFCKSRSFVTSI